MRFVVLMAVVSMLGQSADVPTAKDTMLRYWPRSERAAQRRFEATLNAVPSAGSLRAYHEMVARDPHVAGSSRDYRAAETLGAAFEKLGLEVERQAVWPYLCRPVDAKLEIVVPEHISLPLREQVLAEDAYSGHPELDFGWNAYSGSGDVTSGVVYANYGTKEDFERLAALNVSARGKIVIVRYGQNFRGYKVKYAEAAGAIGLIIYTDPADSGFVRGKMYPEGGYANPTSIQRGSILTLDYAGDPLTPFVAATRGAPRVDPDDVALPRIPVQPVGWAAAEQILSRMEGPRAPRDWQGGLSFTYRITGRDGVTVRLMVKQRRQIVKTYNVVGELRGAAFPDQKIIIGCHYDAWTFGAGDPLSGTMILYECAKSFAALARQGLRPARTIVFANWAAEELGLIGSVEWVEAHRDELSKQAVAYINLDMATMGPNFASSAAAVLKTVIADATRSVPSVSAKTKKAATVFDAWVSREEDEVLPGHPRFGHLGGGSDHVGFYCHLAIPSASLSVGGCEGVSYHSVYDNLAWYRKVVGDDYKPAGALTRIVNTVVARMANATILPIDPVRYGPDVRGYLASLSQTAMELRVPVDFGSLEAAAREYERHARKTYGRVLAAVDRGAVSAGQVACVNETLMGLERQWLCEEGLPGRPWYRHLYAATDETSGYAAWMLPAARYGIEHDDSKAVAAAVRQYLAVFQRLERSMSTLDRCIGTAGGGALEARPAGD